VKAGASDPPGRRPGAAPRGPARGPRPATLARLDPGPDRRPPRRQRGGGRRAAQERTEAVTAPAGQLERHMTQPAPSNRWREARVNEAIAVYVRQAEAGHAPEPESWLGQHADLVDELRSFLADQAGFRRFALELPVGDYELIEEVARGGMGVV